MDDTSPERPARVAAPGRLDAATQAVLDELARDDVVARIWRHDGTVWHGDGPDPGEITNRLGWLTAPGDMRAAVEELESLADNLRAEGARHAVLLGMGGSSLCSEVLRESFEGSPGSPELIVLDSTAPDWVAAVERAIDPVKTVFIVSSKSGTTTEVMSFYSYFRGVMERAVGGAAGRHFIAVTDPGSHLGQVAREQGFRAIFRADPNVGGRYSAFTHFGLVPAAIMGLDLGTLLGRAERAAAASGAGVAAEANRGARLGAQLSGNYREGRDKLTFITSPGVASFGLWAEQLLAESTGKDGRGILPIAGEPFAKPEQYGEDRVFVYLRLEGDDNAASDAHADALKEAGRVVLRRPLEDIYDLGAEFYRWEFATAVVGAAIGIHPFNQPNVQESKDATNRVLAGYARTGELPATSDGSLTDLLAATEADGYVAIMPYIYETEAVAQALDGLRRAILEKHGFATTLGYGPRFLHSTGQLHKGGKPNGAFLQLVQPPGADMPIPTAGYGFATLVAAQARGDMEALMGRGRPAARIDLGADPAEAIGQLTEEV
ncbi:MAG TPA: glucose-6-phosphate isomerase [Chloroflexota bacterium]|nr:glucose-6-phosphate isomerase [Chloroflexota bacterium]